MKNAKAIIFDLGGVLLNIDYKLTISAFKKLGVKNADSFYSKKVQDPIFDKLEAGKISPKEFLEQLQKECNNASIELVENAWNAMLVDLPQSRLDYIKNLRNNYQIFLLSNTNAIHIIAFRKKIGEKQWEAFSSLFDKMYLSHEIRFRKPDKEAFQIILEEKNLKPNEVFFIDDSPQHIETAEKLGIYCHYLQKGEDIATLFPDTIQ
jgi:HAD superfamily hydrolase (TIGR01509 family)